ncbi:MAG: hypothetical protein PHG35_02205 [Dehalococcoidales bacterium]|nr:hypothetical protein [Dehalococcoidales bacterium]
MRVAKNELFRLARVLSEKLDEDDVEKLYETFDYLPLFNRSVGKFGWVYPNGIFHDSLPSLEDFFQEIIG